MGDLCIAHVSGGDWQDVTLRVQRMLREATLIVMRATDRPASHLIRGGTRAPLRELGGETQAEDLRAILEALRSGDVVWIAPDVAFWTKADRDLLRSLLARHVRVSPLPGACELITALVLSGLPADRISFLGTMPSSARARRELLDRMAYEQHTLVCAVRSADVADVLHDVEAVLGNRRVAIRSGREVWRGQIGDAPVWTRNAELVIAGAKEKRVWPEAQVRDCVRSLLVSGESARDAARQVAHLSGWRRKAVYQIALETEHRPHK